MKIITKTKMQAILAVKTTDNSERRSWMKGFTLLKDKIIATDSKMLLVTNYDDYDTENYPDVIDQTDTKDFDNDVVLYTFLDKLIKNTTKSICNIIDNTAAIIKTKKDDILGVCTDLENTVKIKTSQLDSDTPDYQTVIDSCENTDSIKVTNNFNIKQLEKALKVLRLTGAENVSITSYENRNIPTKMETHLNDELYLMQVLKK